WSMDAATVGFHLFMGSPPAHPDNDRPAQDRIRQVAESCNCDRPERRQFFRLDLLPFHHTAPCRGPASMPRIDRPSNLLMVFRARPKDRIDFVVQDRRKTIRI